jgi:hypothetical protein
MRFSVYQVSRKGGREKNEDRMGYCYTRDVRPVRAGRRHGRPPRRRGGGAAGAADHGGDLPARGQAAPGRPAALPARRGHGRPPPAAALRHRARAGRHAAHHRWWPACCRAVRPTGRTAATRACTWCAATSWWPARATIPTPSCRKPWPRWCPWATGQPQRAVHLPGQPRQAGGRHRRPAAAAAGRPRDAVLRRPVGSLADAVITSVLASRPISDAVPELVEQALRQAGPKSDNVTVLAVEWESAETPQPAASPPGRWATTCFASTIQASMLGRQGRTPTNWTTPRSSVRSARSTKPSSARRPKRR